MKFSEHTVLITGGATGIGFGIAEQFLKAGSTVVICGRRESALREAKSQYPELITRVADLMDPAERVSLVEWMTTEFPHVDTLVNNAGIQQRLNIHGSPWQEFRNEIAINLEAPIHLSNLFIPHLLTQKNPSIINITSGLAFVPLTIAPVYSATKAALHSFTLSLRQQLSSTAISVIEIIPPAVNTDLGGKGLHDNATPVHEFIKATVEQLLAGSVETSYGFSSHSSKASRAELDETFARMNQRR